MAYEIRILREAADALQRLDGTIVRRILRKLDWLSANADVIKPKGLKSGFAGLAKLREGDYRIIYEIDHGERQVLVRYIGHRSEVYKYK